MRTVSSGPQDLRHRPGKQSPNPHVVYDSSDGAARLVPDPEYDGDVAEFVRRELYEHNLMN